MPDFVSRGSLLRLPLVELAVSLPLPLLDVFEFALPLFPKVGV